MRAWIGLMGTLFLAAAAGCAGAQTDGAPPLAPARSLADPVAVALAPSAATGETVDSRVTFTIAGGFDAERPEQMSIARPQLSVHTSDGRASLDALQLPLGDIDVPAAALPPSGLKLRNLVLTAAPTRATVLHAEADALELRASLPLALAWSLQLADGSLYRLGDVRTAPLDVDIQIFRAGGRLTATVDARCPGTCWAIDGIARLSDGTVHLEADADVTAAP